MESAATIAASTLQSLSRSNSVHKRENSLIDSKAENWLPNAKSLLRPVTPMGSNNSERSGGTLRKVSGVQNLSQATREDGEGEIREECEILASPQRPGHGRTASTSSIGSNSGRVVDDVKAKFKRIEQELVETRMENEKLRSMTSNARRREEKITLLQAGYDSVSAERDYLQKSYEDAQDEITHQETELQILRESVDEQSKELDLAVKAREAIEEYWAGKKSRLKSLEAENETLKEQADKAIKEIQELKTSNSQIAKDLEAARERESSTEDALKKLYDAQQELERAYQDVINELEQSKLHTLRLDATTTLIDPGFGIDSDYDIEEESETIGNDQEESETIGHHHRESETIGNYNEESETSGTNHEELETLGNHHDESETIGNDQEMVLPSQNESWFVDLLKMLDPNDLPEVEQKGNRTLDEYDVIDFRKEITSHSLLEVNETSTTNSRRRDGLRKILTLGSRKGSSPPSPSAANISICDELELEMAEYRLLFQRLASEFATLDGTKLRQLQRLQKQLDSTMDLIHMTGVKLKAVRTKSLTDY